MKTIAVRYDVRFVAVATMALAIAGLAATAHGRPPGPPPDRLAMLEQRLGKVELDAATKDTVYSILDGARTAQRELQEQLRAEYKALRELLDQTDPDLGAVMTQADRIGGVTTEMRKQHLRTMLAVRAQLTPEQREALGPSRGHEHGPKGDGSHCDHKR